MGLTFIYFVIALLLLISIHEYGHFLVARLCGVQVLRFSFGFGKVLLRWVDKRQTEYVISALPLGGYVKMLDEDDADKLLSSAEKHVAFNNQSVYARMAIVAAGPLFNFILAFVLLWLVLVIGVQSIAPIISSVKPNSIAAQSGLTTRQEIIEVNGAKISSWRDFQYAFIPLLGSDKTIQIKTSSKLDSSIRTVYLSLSKIKFDHKINSILEILGIVPCMPSIPPIIGQIIHDSPASKVDLVINDTIQAVNGHPIHDWLEFIEQIRRQPNTMLKLDIIRNKQKYSVNITSASQIIDGQQTGYVGLYAKKITLPAHWLRVQKEPVMPAAKHALIQTMDLIAASYATFWRLVTGKLGFGTISGPIGIAKAAGDSARMGLAYYLSFLALISINLGVLNLLPVPLLDGGHLLYLIIELISGRSISKQIKTAGANIGFIIVIFLMFFAITNDLLY